MKSKQALVKELEKIVEHTTEQNTWHKRSKQYLYSGLAWVYLWWREAKQVDGLLDELYEKNNIRGQESEDEKFTRLIRLTWRLDWADESKATLQQWSLALREIHKEYETNKAAYKTDAQKKLTLYIDNIGGIRKLIGADKYYKDVDATTEKKPKTKAARSAEDEAIVEARHVELGETHFSSARPISTIQSTKPIVANRKGYAIALIRMKKGNTFDVLATISDDTQIRKAIIASYKRQNAVAPTILRVLAEVIQTQSLPLALEKHRYKLVDSKNVTLEDGRVFKNSQNKRVLFRKKQGDIVFSENRTSCSVVTIATPNKVPLTSSKDVFLNVNDRRYIEQALVQRNELSLYTSNDKDKVPVLRDADVKASHKLVLENKLLNKKRSVYFYTLDTIGEHSRPQACVTSDTTSATWTTKVDKLWFENLNAMFVSQWLSEYGEHITRAKHKTMRFEFSAKQLVIKHYGEKENLSTASKPIDLTSAVKGKAIKLLMLSKDVMPVLEALANTDVNGNITLSANEDALTIAYQTDIAKYKIAIPTCNASGKRIGKTFVAYGE
jgi:hypothetical protein